MIKVNGAVRLYLLKDRAFSIEEVKSFNLYNEFKDDFFFRLSLKSELDDIFSFDNIEDYDYTFLEWLADKLRDYFHEPPIKEIEIQNIDEQWIDVAYVVDIDVEEYFNKYEEVLLCRIG